MLVKQLSGNFLAQSAGSGPVTAKYRQQLPLSLEKVFITEVGDRDG